MGHTYAKLNKETLRFIRDTKRISYEYIARIVKFSEDKVKAWEDNESTKLPTIKQAKDLAKCYRIPFAGFYMNSEDINVKHLPRFINKRTMIGAGTDDSAVNLALLDLLGDREFLLETKETLHESIPTFDLMIRSNDVDEWAKIIREFFSISIDTQFKTTSKRKFYLYVRKQIEERGIFIQSFIGVDTTVLRGVAIVDDLMPIIGLNDKDRYPAKTFSIVHELVHIIKRTSSICNDMYGSTSMDEEEVFCNAVAGEVLVPKEQLRNLTKNRQIDDFMLDDVDSLADKFSVSSEVIARRLWDIGKCSKAWYNYVAAQLDKRLQMEKEQQKAARQMGLNVGPKRNMPREAIDRTSPSMCTALLRGYSEGLFDKTDLSAYTKIGQKHIDKFVSEVMGWYL